MDYMCRDGAKKTVSGGQQRVLNFLYGTALGRILLRPLVFPWLSKLAGWALSRRISCVLIKPFIRANDIDMSQFEDADFSSYNSFFTRKIRPGARSMEQDPDRLISPCDSKLLVLPITHDGQFTIKNTSYTISTLLQDGTLAEEYAGGTLMIFRLSVDDYHRYCYPASGEVSGQKRIPGRYHTVMPIANDHVPVYKENTREYCLLDTERFGRLVLMEVGAMLVGRIVNYPVDGSVARGLEKGCFEFGGSTIVIAAKASAVCVDEDILEYSASGLETVVRYGEGIATVVK